MKTIGAILFVMSCAACAADPIYMPYPLANISVEQWTNYRQAVEKAYGPTRRSFPEEHLETFSSSNNNLHFAFTIAGHPAHPAWITREAKSGSVNQIGYFAGKEEDFAELFNAYLALTNKTIKSLSDNEPEK
jgi:hypothetical protein